MSADPGPTFTIVVPTFGRPRQLARCLEALERLESPAGGFEVIVVDDGSEPPIDLEPSKARLIRQANGGPGAARNAGAAAAHGRFLAFIDDDCLPEPGWLAALARRLEERSEVIAGGPIVNHLTENPYSAAWHVVMDAVYAHYNAGGDQARFFASCNMAVAAAGFAAIGGFDQGRFRMVSEDRELCDRWRSSGRPMSFVPGAVVRHAPRLNLRSFMRLFFIYGRGAARFHRIRKVRGASEGTGPASFYLRLPSLLRVPMARLPAARRWQVGALLVAWQLANVSGFLHERLFNRRQALG